MQEYIIGIDTGGTFTDAVVIDAANGRVVATAKEPTTHQRLAVGTGNALRSLFSSAIVKPEHIQAVAVSSTLATNSVVEHKGARVALLVIGYVKHFNLPVKAVVYIKGGHTITGEEEEPLDLEYLVDIVTSLKNEVDAYGVCAAMSIANPAHELVAEKAISLIDPKPVFCSHRISTLAGMQERAATAGLHARLMPIMHDYVTGVTEAMAAQGLHCPMSVIGGNADVISSEEAIRQAGITVASGPACTAFFGSQHATDDCLVIDVGGTTTDIAMIKGGLPLLSKDGCTIGDWKTHIEAVDMHTGGIGGDSLVDIASERGLDIGPVRVSPLAMAADFPDPAQWLGGAGRSRCIRIAAERGQAADGQPALRELLRRGPVTPEQLGQAIGLSGVPLEAQLEQLTRMQMTTMTGFTPTDALHVLGEIDIGDRGRSLAGAKVLGGLMGLEPEELCLRVIAQTEEKIENLILSYIFGHYWNKAIADFISSRNSYTALRMDISLKLPLLGIGAAARFFLPRIADRLATTVTFPENYAVGNAIGAALICRKALVRP